MLNVIFTVLFTVEMVLKLMAFKAKVSPHHGLQIQGESTSWPSEPR